MTRQLVVFMLYTVAFICLLSACESTSGSNHIPNPPAQTFVPSADQHSCLTIEISLPNEVALGSSSVFELTVKNTCSTSVQLATTDPASSFFVLRQDNKVVWKFPEGAKSGALFGYSIPANGQKAESLTVVLSNENKDGNASSAGQYRVVGRFEIFEPESVALDSAPQLITAIR